MSSIPGASSPSNLQPSTLGSCEAASTTIAALGESSLAQVAQRVGVDADALRAANPQLGNPDNLAFGAVINVPAHDVNPPAQPPTPPPAPVRRLEGLGVYHVDMQGGTRVVVEQQVVGASRPADAVVKMAKRGNEVLVSHELRREGHYAQLLTRFEGTAADMKVTQRLYRWDAQAKTMVDVTQEASRAGPLAVDWNMPAAPATGYTLPSMGDTAKHAAAEMIVGEIPPSLVIPYVKDSILVEHFEFTPAGQHPYLHWSDTIARRWAATGERKTSYYYNKAITAVGAVSGAAGEVNAIGRSVKSMEKIAPKLAKVEARAASTAAHIAQDGAHDASKVTKGATNASHAADGAADAAKNAKAPKQLGNADRNYWANTKPETHNPMAGREGVTRDVSDIGAARAAKKPTGPETPPTGGAAGKPPVVANDNEAIKAQKIAVGDTSGSDARTIKATKPSGPKPPEKPPGEPRFLTSDPKPSAPAADAPAAKPAPAHPAPVAAPPASQGHYGNWKADDLMTGTPYKPTQRDLYRGTVEEMADAMKAKKFDWAKSKVDPIIIDKNGKILSGHHRIVAARLAKEPIPESAITRVPADTIRDTRPWTGVTVRAGEKP